jgi:hypothetical protein
MPNANSIITRALRLIGATGAGQTPSPDDMSDGFDVLNDMMDGWAADGMTIPATARTEFVVPNLTGIYTLGPTGSIVAARPGKIDRAGWKRVGSNIESPLTPLDLRRYQGIPDKALTSSIPDEVWVENQGVLVRIEVLPHPTELGTLVLYMPTVLTQFADYTTIYSFLPGYSRAIRYNLARDLMPEYPDLVSPDAAGKVLTLAAEYLADVRRANIRPETIIPDVPAASLRGGYNIFTDE